MIASVDNQTVLPSPLPFAVAPMAGGPSTPALVAGRSARALANRFAREHSASAPVGYPEVHHLTRPLRVEAAKRGELDALHLWAGTGWRDARAEPAADVLARLTAETA